MEIPTAHWSTSICRILKFARFISIVYRLFFYPRIQRLITQRKRSSLLGKAHLGKVTRRQMITKEASAKGSPEEYLHPPQFCHLPSPSLGPSCLLLPADTWDQCGNMSPVSSVRDGKRKHRSFHKTSLLRILGSALMRRSGFIKLKWKIR